MAEEKGIIRPIRMEDVEVMHAWEHDEEIATASGIIKPRSLEVFQAAYAKYFLKVSDSLRLFSITLGGRVIGRAELGLIDRENGNAAFGIVIGDKSCWGKGYGKQAICDLLGWAFAELHLHKIYCEVYTFNDRSMNMMRSIGFHQDGVLREHEYFNGEYHDVAVFSILQSEYTKNKRIRR
ncbi:GNAT family N-acetyltransferase [Listeria grandensis]|uniref:GNAT family N-acetyltransferase n=1 Tax=Listeria grandensis TaxID=1494963 RepID=UPI00164D5433|nr:GNAT family protein [Listeria grandensis]MBC6314969.1 GNAT family N-acetyltransferase [Listeria grandensis]